MRERALETEAIGALLPQEETIERLAEAFVHAFEPSFFSRPSPFDVDRFAQTHLGLLQDYRQLSSAGDYDGALILCDTDQFPIYDPVTHEMHNATARGKTLILDARLLDDEPHYRMATAHFCGHAALHFLPENRHAMLGHPTESLPFFLCHETAVDTPVSRCTTIRSVLEWQATRFALAIMMPRQAVNIVTVGMRAHDPRSVELVLHDIVEAFGVPMTAARVRLKALQLVVA